MTAELLVPLMPAGNVELPQAEAANIHVAAQARASAARRTRTNERLVRIGEVLHRVGVHRGTIYKWIKEGRFPRQVSLGLNSCAWYESEIDEWIADPTGWRAPGQT